MAFHVDVVGFGGESAAKNLMDLVACLRHNCVHLSNFDLLAKATFSHLIKDDCVDSRLWMNGEDTNC